VKLICPPTLFSMHHLRVRLDSLMNDTMPSGLGVVMVLKDGS
jgi:hypothetical protein